ncbi:MAG TPA: efflux RND transporter periplasmic adaptor subunit [Bryobacteraceae bacterium]|nr:efflux RND transporter periplasmic adaptor subunit [Bryobacteraceae bacterium]
MKVVIPRGAPRKGALLLALLLAVVGGYSIFPRSRASAKANVDPAPTQRPTRHTGSILLASPGRIEARSDVVNVGAAIDGVISAIRVKEGQTVRQGEVLAELGCSDLQSAVQVASANRDSLQEARLRLERGSRPEEREAASEKTAAAQAVREQATEQLSRMSKLYAAQEISRLAFEEAQRDRNVAEAQFQQAQKNEQLVNAGPLPEEQAKADAEVSSAEASLKLAQDKLGKCTVRAPFAGTILRVLLREGESFGTLSPRPLFTMADVSSRRVRAEVDEDDIASVRIGQKVLVSADAYGNRTFSGVVTKLANIMGRQTVVTGDPAQKADRDILEVTGELGPESDTLPIGLRVTVQFVR